MYHVKIVMMLVSKGVLPPFFLTPDCYVICTPASLTGESELAEKHRRCVYKKKISQIIAILLLWEVWRIKQKIKSSLIENKRVAHSYCVELVF